MVNTQFTKGKVPQKINIGKQYKLVFDDQGKVLCGYNKKGLCDLNGNKIASFASKKTNRNTGIKETKFNSELGNFRLIGKALFYNDARVGALKSGVNKSNIVLLLMTIAILVLSFGTVLLIDTPNSERPIIELHEEDGKIEATKKIAVFDPTIKPGSKGAYQFQIRNDKNKEMIYSFSITEYYDNQPIANFPINYRIKMNNMYLLYGQEWVRSEALTISDMIIPEYSRQLFILEWQWPLDSNQDSLDTYFGSTGKDYYIVVHVTAQFID